MCIASNQREMFATSMVSWQTVNGVEYHIRVAGSTARDFGDFQLSLTVDQECGGAIPIGPNDGVTVGDTGTAVPDWYLTPCTEDASSTSPALWYRVAAAVTAPHAVTMRADTCDESTDKDTAISIIQQHTCTSSTRTCTVFNDNDARCGEDSPVN